MAGGLDHIYNGSMWAHKNIDQWIQLHRTGIAMVAQKKTAWFIMGTYLIWMSSQSQSNQVRKLPHYKNPPIGVVSMAPLSVCVKTPTPIDHPRNEQTNLWDCNSLDLGVSNSAL